MGGDTLEDKTTVEELTCLELARMWDTEDVSVPWEWKQQHQQQQEEDDNGIEGREKSGSDV